jgi:hypothetical protein
MGIFILHVKFPHVNPGGLSLVFAGIPLNYEAENQIAKAVQYLMLRPVDDANGRCHCNFECAIIILRMIRRQE